MTDEMKRPSFAEIIRFLEIGETATKAERIQLGSRAAKDLAAVLSRLRNNVNNGVARVKRSDGSNFRVESGTFVTDDKRYVIVTACATRVEDDPEAGSDDI